MNRTYLVHGLALVGLGLLALAFPSEPAWSAVGRTEAAYGVTQNGSVAYSIPIRVTEGIGGLTPNLAITYTGPGSRSILGVGFSLSGISYITPCRKTIAQDLNAAPVTLTSADRYCLDGARLRLVSGTYGASGATYRTELDQLVRVTSLNSTNGIPGSFKVEMPNGLEYEYGNTTDSKLLASAAGGAPPQFWAVNKISDPSGNSMKFVYDTDNSTRRFRPSYIEYTASAAGVGRYRVTFVYITAISQYLFFTPSWNGGAGKSDDKTLDRLDLSHDGVVYRKINLTYQNGAGSNRRLTSIQECVPGSPDDCLGATTFNWQSATSGHSTTPATSYAVASGVMPLDINGDGFEDLAWAASGTWRYMLGSASGFGSVVNTGVTATNSTKAMPLEFNGDGRWDLLIDWSDGKWRVLTGTAAGLSTSPIHAGPGAGIPSNAANTSWTIADADNDGRDDLFSMQLNADLAIYIRFNSASGFGSSTLAIIETDVTHTLSQGFIKKSGMSAITRPDFNGDGRTDLVVYGCYWDPEPPAHCIFNAWFQLVSNGSTYVNVGPLPSAAFNIDVRYADFNADGLTDVAYPASTNIWKIGFGQGSGAVSIVNGPSTSGYTTYQTLTGDYDGDGYDDLYTARISGTEWDVFRSTGTALESIPIDSNVSSAGAAWMLVDQTGDGLADLGRYDSGTLVWGTYLHQGAPGEHLTSAVDGLGNAVAFSYLPMSNASIYTRGTGATYPTRDVQFTAPLVSSMQVVPAGAASFTLSYKYKDGRSHAQGRSFLGMGTREITDTRNTVFTSETYRQDFPYVGAPATVTGKQSSAGNTIQLITHTYSNHVLNATSGNERYLPYRSKTVTKVHEVGGVKDGLQITEITEEHTVNTLGNSTLVLTKIEDKDASSAELGSIWRNEVTSTYSEDSTNWCLAMPLTRSEKRILPDATNETRSASWAVDGAQCRVTQETIQPGAGSLLSLVTDLEYDNCGNVDLVKSYPAGQIAQARITEFGYGTRCQRPEMIENPLDQQSTIAYNWSLALPTSHTDPNGIAAGMAYDGFGRLIRRDNADGTDVTYALSACTAGNNWCGKASSAARVRVTQTARTTSDATIRTDEQFLDGLGRVRWSHVASPDSGPAMVRLEYDGFGQLIAQSQPCFACDPNGYWWTNYSRDVLGRVTQVDQPIAEGQGSGRTTNFVFEGRDTEIVDPKSFTTARRSNALGQLRFLIDPSSGITTYAYHPFGEIASIKDAANNSTTWTYNIRGFVIQNSDPDSGTSAFENNAFGEMERMRDAKTSAPSWTVQFTYDKLSRPLTRIDLSPSGTTSFNWGTSAAARNIGRLASVTSPGSYSESYGFDSIGRLSQQSVVADGTTFNVNLAYVATTGLLDTVEYPTSTSGYRLKLRQEYANGQLKRVRDANGSTVFWEAVSTDAFGHVQQELFGNGVSTFTAFDQASGLMSYRHGGVGGGTGLINSEVDWDLNGNLTKRRDLKLSPAVTEDFFYDSLNRFDYSELNGATNADVTLDAIGNILWKKDVCPTGANCYSYHATQKRAVVTAGSNSYGYDAAGNMTSRNGSSISYASYNLPTVISAGAGYSSTLSYGAFRNRYKQIAVTPTGTETTIYVAGLMERVTRGGTTEYRHLIRGANGTAAIHTRVSGGGNTTYYLHRDHLGSPELITDAAGNELVRPSFGAYGERRDGTDWSGPPSAADLTDIANSIRRGFTGHEHLDAVGLIHMNGRVYDPVVARFLEVDPIIQEGSSQAVNSYGYVWNNPLALVDPSGFDVGSRDKVVVACINGLCTDIKIGDLESFMDIMGAQWEHREPTIEEKRIWAFPSTPYGSASPNWDGKVFVVRPRPLPIEQATDYYQGFLDYWPGASLGNCIYNAMWDDQCSKWGWTLAVVGVVPQGKGGALLGKSAATKGGLGALEEASEAAFRASQGPIKISRKHFPGAGGGYNKFAEGVDIDATIREALRAPGAVFRPNRNAAGELIPGYRVYTDLGRTVGTKGETGIRTIVSPDGRVITSYPGTPW